MQRYILLLCFEDLNSHDYYGDFLCCFPNVVFPRFPYCFLLFPRCFCMFLPVFLQFPMVFLLFPCSVSPLFYFRLQACSLCFVNVFKFQDSKFKIVQENSSEIKIIKKGSLEKPHHHPPPSPKLPHVLT